VLTDCLERLHLNHVSTVEVAWITVPAETMKLCQDAGKKVGIRVLFNKRPPFQKLDTAELVIRSWLGIAIRSLVCTAQDIEQERC
jgi:hypothetical protein